MFRGRFSGLFFSVYTMNLKTLFIAIISFLSIKASAQVATVSGKVVDNVTKQPVVGAKLMFSPQLRTLSDPDGNYEIKNIPFGKYTMVVTMPSFDTLKVDMSIDKSLVNYSVILGGSQELEEIKVIGNIVSDRKTPVAVTKISTQKIAEELFHRNS